MLSAGIRRMRSSIFHGHPILSPQPVRGWATAAPQITSRRWTRTVFSAVALLSAAKVTWACWPLFAPGSVPLDLSGPVLKPHKPQQLASPPPAPDMAHTPVIPVGTDPTAVPSWEAWTPADGQAEPSLLWLIATGSDRLIRCIATGALVIGDYLMHQSQEDWGPVHERCAARIFKLCQVNKGIYIKLGQHVGQLQYLLPREYVQAMLPLLAAAPQDEPEQVREMLLQELGGTPEQLFAEWDDHPIASASLAQVHRARAWDGRELAVKVQHAGLADTSVADVKIIAALVNTVRALFPAFEYTWLLREVQYNLPRELTFTLEGANACRTAKQFEGNEHVVVPAIHWDLTTPKVLTMSFELGEHIAHAAQVKSLGLDPAEVASLVSSTFAQQIFQDGCVNADPHAGNLLIRADQQGRAQLVLLDHGLIRPLDDKLRITYARLWRAIIFADEPGIAKYTHELGAGQLYQLFTAMLTTKSWDVVMDPALDSLTVASTTTATGDYTADYAKQYSDEIQDILRTVPREVLLLLKTNDCLRAVDAALGAPVNTFVITARHCSSAIHDAEKQAHPGLRTWLACAWDRVKLEVRLAAFAASVAAAAVVHRAAGGQASVPGVAEGATHVKEQEQQR